MWKTKGLCRLFGRILQVFACFVKHGGKYLHICLQIIDDECVNSRSAGNDLDPV